MNVGCALEGGQYDSRPTRFQSWPRHQGVLQAEGGNQREINTAGKERICHSRPDVGRRLQPGRRKARRVADSGQNTPMTAAPGKTVKKTAEPLETSGPERAGPRRTCGLEVGR
jgi:hypothetical protein